MPAGQALSQAHLSTAIKLLANGATQAEVGNMVGVSQRTMSNIARERKADIDALMLRYIEASIPFIEQNHTLTLALAHKLLSLANSTKPIDFQAMAVLRTRLEGLGIDTKTLLTLADKKEFRAGQAMGMFPSHSPSMVLNMLFQSGSQAVISPAMSQVLSNFGAELTEIPDIED